MSHDHPGRRHRGEQGDASPEILVIAFFMVIFSGVVVTAITGWVQEKSLGAIATDALLLVGGMVALVLVFVASLALWVRLDDRANRRTRTSMGPKLLEWLDHPDRGLHDEDLKAWRKAARSGLTVAEAQRWSDHGTPYATAAAARRRGLSIAQVIAIGEAMKDGGLWDGTDREVFDHCIARQTSHIADTFPRTVIHRWARFAPEQITAAFARRLAMPDVAAAADADTRRYTSSTVPVAPYPGPIWRRTGYAFEVLSGLERPDRWSAISGAAEARATSYRNW